MSKKEAVREALITEISNNRSVAPRDIAQKLMKEGEDWRSYLTLIRETAIDLEGENVLTFLRKGKPVSSKGLKGVYRLAKKD